MQPRNRGTGNTDAHLRGHSQTCRSDALENSEGATRNYGATQKEALWKEAAKDPAATPPAVNPKAGTARATPPSTAPDIATVFKANTTNASSYL
ncbi:hypothetical protein TNCT_105191 [Trichonephila clavata]|uniref:Uncharacterized protein n=1 Tax=Trichonephila clavata TaxID=2740835 RepID=A0A8X6L9M9_TRICU|nr:hypothetical protein TNCT_105191 [Trichonephila clavata]